MTNISTLNAVTVLRQAHADLAALHGTALRVAFHEDPWVRANLIDHKEQLEHWTSFLGDLGADTVQPAVPTRWNLALQTAAHLGEGACLKVLSWRESSLRDACGRTLVDETLRPFADARSACFEMRSAAEMRAKHLELLASEAGPTWLFPHPAEGA